MRPCSCLGLCLVAAAAAQQPAVVLPVLPLLGPVPDATVLTLAAEDVTLALPASARQIVLRVDRAMRAGDVIAALDTLRECGLDRVHCAATLPDGTPGSLSIALPDAARVDATLTLRAHHERPGVTADSVVPLLQRLRTGWEREPERVFVLEIDLPAFASWQQCIELIAAAADARVCSIAMRSTARSASHTATSLALDLAGRLAARVPPLPATSRAPSRSESAHGCLVAAPAPPVRTTVCRGWLRPEVDTAVTAVRRQQRDDGSFVGEDGAVDLEAVGLAALLLHAWQPDGDAPALERCIGWLVVNQRADGGFADARRGALQRHAIVTRAIVESADTSCSLLDEWAAAAVRFLCAARASDGGFGADADSPSDPIATAWAVAALAAAEEARIPVTVRAEDVVAWFDAHAVDAPLPAAAELYARYITGQDTATAPRIRRLVALAKSVNARDPDGAFWATAALYQHGGAAWPSWSSTVKRLVIGNQVRHGELAGWWRKSTERSALTSTMLNALAVQGWYRNGAFAR